MSRIGNMRRSIRGAARAALIASVALPALTMALPSLNAVRAQTSGPAGAPQTVAADVRSVLAQYGSFVVHQKYGEVWIPTVTPEGWHPYMACHWRNDSRLGWFYDDSTPWGSIVHHYGRWAHDPDAGWMWIPGAEFSPGWVAWRTNPQWIGWAPLPPDEDLQNVATAAAFNNGDLWTFMETAKFDAGCTDGAVVAPDQVAPLLQQTAYVTNFQMVDGILVAALPAFVTGPQVTIDFTFDPWPEWFFAQTLIDWNWFWNNVAIIINVNTPDCPPATKPNTPPGLQVNNNNGCLPGTPNCAPLPPPVVRQPGGGGSPGCTGGTLVECLTFPPGGVRPTGTGTKPGNGNVGNLPQGSPTPGGKTVIGSIQCPDGVAANGQCNGTPGAPPAGGSTIAGIACPNGPAVNGQCPEGNGTTGTFTKCAFGEGAHGNCLLPPTPPNCPDGAYPNGDCYLPGTNPNGPMAQHCQPPLVPRGNFCVNPTFSGATVNPSTIKTLQSPPIGGPTPPPAPRPASGQQGPGAPPPSLFGSQNAGAGGRASGGANAAGGQQAAGGNVAPPRPTLKLPGMPVDIGVGRPSGGVASRPAGGGPVAGPASFPSIAGPRGGAGAGSPRPAGMVLSHGGAGFNPGGGMSPRPSTAGFSAGMGASAIHAMPTRMPSAGAGMPRFR